MLGNLMFISGGNASKGVSVWDADEPLNPKLLSSRQDGRGMYFTIRPKSPLLPGKTYEVVVVAGGLRDWAGNANLRRHAFRFSTGATVDFSGVSILHKHQDGGLRPRRF